MLAGRVNTKKHSGASAAFEEKTLHRISERSAHNLNHEA